MYLKTVNSTVPKGNYNKISTSKKIKIAFANSLASDVFQKSSKENELSEITSKIQNILNILEIKSETSDNNLHALSLNLDKIFKFVKEDPLSGAYSKKMLFSDLATMLNNLQSSGSTLSVCMFDMDNFKSVNEVLGYIAGDNFIRETAKSIKSVADKYNLNTYRFGGDEFVVLLPNKNKEESRLISEEIKKAIQNNKEISSHSKLYLEAITQNIQNLEKKGDLNDTGTVNKLKKWHEYAQYAYSKSNTVFTASVGVEEFNDFSKSPSYYIEAAADALKKDKATKKCCTNACSD